jgi:ABC-type amino acid transport substrate-binding protein
MQQEIKVGLDFAAPIPLHTDFSSETFEGFEVDLMKYISEELGLKLAYEVCLWKDILERLKKEKIDVICSAVTVTPGRKIALDFTQPYLLFRLCAVTNNANTVSSINQLDGKDIGVRKATEAEAIIKDRLPGSKLVVSNTNEELYQLLMVKKIDALIDDSPIAGAFVKLNKQLKVAFFLPGTDSEYAIAVRKGNTPLQDSINVILAGMAKNGIWQKLHDKWFEGIIL